MKLIRVTDSVHILKDHVYMFHMLSCADQISLCVMKILEICWISNACFFDLLVAHYFSCIIHIELFSIVCLRAVAKALLYFIIFFISRSIWCSICHLQIYLTFSSDDQQHTNIIICLYVCCTCKAVFIFMAPKIIIIIHKIHTNLSILKTR